MAARATKHETQKRQNDALKLRLAGATYDDIATSLGFSNKSHAWKAVDAAIKAERREDVDALLELELARLDRMQRGVWTAAARGDEKAIDRVLKVMEHRAKLTGLYNVQAQGNDDEVRAALAGFLAAAQATIPDATILHAPIGADATIPREQA